MEYNKKINDYHEITTGCFSIKEQVQILHDEGFSTVDILECALNYNEWRKGGGGEWFDFLMREGIIV